MLDDLLAPHREIHKGIESAKTLLRPRIHPAAARASQHVLALPMLHTSDERHYSYFCSCEDMMPGLQVLTGLDSITNPKATWDKTAGRCLHSRAIEALRGNEDSITISDLEENALHRRVDEEVVLDNGEPVFIISPGSGTDFLLSVALEAGYPRIFVGADNAGHLRCLACKSKDCQHCHFVHSWVEEQDGGEWDMAQIFEGISLQGDSSHAESAVPSMTLPVQQTTLPPDYCSTTLASRSLGAGQFFPAGSLSMFSDGCMHLIPGLHGCCSTCQSVWSASDPMQAGWVAVNEGCVYGLSGCHPAKVYFRRCLDGACPGVQQYDGHCDRIFNYSNRSLFTYEVCFNYADGMVISRLPFATHWQLLKRNYARGGQFDMLCSRGTHRRAMLEFIKLIDVDYVKSFTCSTCDVLQHSELVFIIDGKEMGMNRALSKPYVPPLSPSEEAVPVQCPHARTVPFPSQAGRTLLNRWVAALDRKGEVLGILAEDDFEELLVYAEKLPGLGQALQGVLIRYPGDATVRLQCPLEMRPLFKCIAKNYQTSGMLAPAYASGALRRLIRGQDRAISGTRKRALAEGFPALHAVVSSCRWTQLPAELLPLPEVLITKACYPTQCPEVGGMSVTNAAAEADHVFMPAFPLCRDLPAFKQTQTKSAMVNVAVNTTACIVS
ncbi:hypothetical protein COCOBI_01-6980 [Coccomyxa sp. Obi]|nr:hypothetical protein COCOBI_01-6980 [Coccomyxa sp. Obi]